MTGTEASTYYTEGKDAAWFETLPADNLAWELTKASQDIVDGDFGAIEAFMPISAMLSVASNCLSATASALKEAERFMAYFAGETDRTFEGPGTPTSCLAVIRAALSQPPSAQEAEPVAELRCQSALSQDEPTYRTALIRNEEAGFTEIVTEDVPTITGQMEARNVEPILRMGAPRGELLGYRVYDAAPASPLAKRG